MERESEERPAVTKHEKSLTYTTTDQILNHSDASSFHVTAVPSTDSTIETDRQLFFDEATYYGYCSTRNGGYMSQDSNDFPSIMSQQSMLQTPDLEPMPNSTQSGASLELLTPLNTHSVRNGSSVYGTTGISPYMERFNFGDPNQISSYLGDHSYQMRQKEAPAGLFQTKQNEAESLENIGGDLQSLPQFPEAHGGESRDACQIEEQDSSLAAPSSASLGNNDFACTASSSWPSHDGHVTSPGAAQYPRNFDSPDDIFQSLYLSYMWNPPSKSVGDSPVSTSLLSRKPLSPRGIGHITTPEKRQRKSSAVRGLSTESFQPSGIVDTMFEKCRGKSTALCLQTLDEEIIKKEGASAAQREAADCRRKRERRFKCRICGDTLTSSQNLKNHTNSHTGNKPYKCEYCQDKNFRHLRSLSRHVKKKHS